MGLLDQLNWLRATIDQLVLQASKVGSPRLYAEVTMDNLPAFMTPERLQEFVGSADWWARLVQIDDRVIPYQPWFTAYRTCVLRLVQRAKERAAKVSATKAHANGAQLSQAQTPEPSLPGTNEPTQESFDE